MKKGEKESAIAKEKNRLAHLGKTLSKETKEKISLSKTGTKLSEEHKNKISEAHKGHIGWNKGKHWKLSEESKKKMSLAKIGRPRPDMVREKNNAWAGGKRGYLRRAALIRDNHTCQKCGFSNKDIMIVDHIKPRSVFPELEFDLNNLMTLCPNCNSIKTLEDIRRHQAGIKRGDKWKK